MSTLTLLRDEYRELHIFQHGENTEAVFQVTDIEWWALPSRTFEEQIAFVRELNDWLNRVHKYEMAGHGDQ